MNKQQQEQVGFMVMWASQWQVGLDLAHAQIGERLAPSHHEQFQIDHKDWHAYMARKECLELGLDPKVVLSAALIICADRWHANNVKGAEDEWCFEEAAQ